MPDPSIALLCGVSDGLSWLLRSSAARSPRILLGTRLDDPPRIRSDRAVLRVPGSRLAVSLASLAARAMRALWNACRPRASRAASSPI